MRLICSIDRFPGAGARQAQLLKGPKFLEGVLSAHPACSAQEFRLPADHGGLQLTVADHCVPVRRRMSSFRNYTDAAKKFSPKKHREKLEPLQQR